MRLLIPVFLLMTRLALAEWVPVKLFGIQNYDLPARQARIQGEVTLKCRLDSSGTVSGVDTLEGHPLLAKQASENVRRWKFERKSGMENEVVVNYSYRLIGTGTRKTPKVEFEFQFPNKVVVTSEHPCIDHAPCEEDYRKNR